VALHRRVDGFTDAHPTFRRSKRRLSPRFGHYAGILVDVFYDHCLALRWDEHSEEPLDRFAGRIYESLRARRHRAPEALRPLIDGMRRVDLLTAYRESRGVERALGSISRRLSRTNGLDQALPDLEGHRAALDADFAEFFPELLAHLGAPPATTTRAGAAPRPSAHHGPG
jgi:acyl carrier protein phosphodiesterase